MRRRSRAASTAPYPCSRYRQHIHEHFTLLYGIINTDVRMRAFTHPRTRKFTFHCLPKVCTHQGHGKRFHINGGETEWAVIAKFYQIPIDECKIEPSRIAYEYRLVSKAIQSRPKLIHYFVWIFRILCNISPGIRSCLPPFHRFRMPARALKRHQVDRECRQ